MFGDASRVSRSVLWPERRDLTFCVLKRPYQTRNHHTRTQNTSTITHISRLSPFTIITSHEMNPPIPHNDKYPPLLYYDVILRALIVSMPLLSLFLGCC